MDRPELFRVLPSVDEVLRRPAAEALIAARGRPVVTAACRALLARVREALRAGSLGDAAAVLAQVSDAALEAEVRRRLTPGLRRVINATGVVLHTNLGRAPLSDEAVVAVRAAAGGVSLEIDLSSGGRGRRESAVAAVTREILGCEAATVVNNCAAALMIVLRTVAEGREVLVSRGELVEIGGGFRVPEVIAQSGCRLVEVGTTNRTRLSDYARAAGPRTGAILSVHRSNFALIGFTASVGLAELAPLARELGVPLIHDLGSGLLDPSLARGLLAGETTPQDSLEAGAELVCFSGDKLLGGPQSGLIAGRGALVARIEAHPLMRALRCDKLTLAALESTLRAYRDGRPETVPVVRRLSATVEALAAQAVALRERLEAAGIAATLIEVEDAVGGGSAPEVRLPGIAVGLPGQSPEALAARLRLGEPSVLGVVQEGVLRLHQRTVAPEELEALAEAVRAAVRGEADLP